MTHGRCTARSGENSPREPRGGRSPFTAGQRRRFARQCRSNDYPPARYCPVTHRRRPLWYPHTRGLPLIERPAPRRDGPCRRHTQVEECCQTAPVRRRNSHATLLARPGRSGRRCWPTTGLARAHGLLIPEEKTVPPLAMLNHKVTVTIDDQVAVTRVEQTFRNHTDRQLEATYVFPVPKGASVNKFSMWVNGKEVKGELVEADKARKIYTDIVRRTQDPGLLEYIGNNLLQLRVFPIPPRSDQKVSLSYTSRQRPDGRPGRVRLSAEDRRQGDSDAGEVRHRGDHQVAARRPEHLQPDARHHRRRRQTTSEVDRRLREEPGPARQGLPALLPARRQGRRPDRADASADRRRARLLHAADVAARWS